jgi:hypothetical protein
VFLDVGEVFEVVIQAANILLQPQRAPANAKENNQPLINGRRHSIYVCEYGGGVMVIERKQFGHAFLTYTLYLSAARISVDQRLSAADLFFA